MENIKEILSENTYPGRGIIVGISPDGTKSTVAYFIMGRSVNSRNRIFEKTEDGIRTKAYDESKMVDPSLIIYHPVRKVGDKLIVTNGDQTDTIRDFLLKGGSFEEALRTREFEPDGPNWTPRISAEIEANGEYKLSILKSYDLSGEHCLRQTYEYPKINGAAHFIHTYKCDGNPIPSFAGEPELTATVDSMEEYVNILWESLNEDNKVSLYVRYTDLATGEYEEKIVNKNGN